jgi:hypothetical protein
MERLRASLGESVGVQVELARFRDGWWIRADVYVDETGLAQGEIPPSVTGVPVQRRTIFMPSASRTAVGSCCLPLSKCASHTLWGVGMTQDG